MKVVFCKKCNAKYQLDDGNDISDYECTVCDGDLELDDEYSINDNINTNDSDSNTKSKSSTNIFSKSKDRDKYDIVYCNECGLKYRIGKNENVSNYECDVCDGELSYVDENLNYLVDVDSKHTIEIKENNDHNYNNGNNNLNNRNHNNNNFNNSNSNSNDNTESTKIQSVDYTNDRFNRYEVEKDRFEDSIEIVRSKHKSKEKERIKEAILSGSLDYGFIAPIHRDNRDNSQNNNVINPKNTNLNSNVNNASTKINNNNLNIGSINGNNNSNPSDNNNSYNSKDSNLIKNELRNDYEFEDFEQAKYNKIKYVALVNFSNNLDKIYSIPTNSNNIDTDITPINTANNSSNSVSKPINNIDIDNVQKGDFTVINKDINNNANINTNIDSNINAITDNDKNKKSSSNNKGKGSKKDVFSKTKITGSFHDYFIISGLIVALLGFSEFVLTSRLYEVIFIGIGIGIFAYGVYLNKKNQFAEKRSRIIREALLTLPSNFYVLYYLKTPNSNAPINHVVLGPTGVFTILTQKYASKEKSELKKDEETLELINNLKDNETISSKKELAELLGTKNSKKQFGVEYIDTSKNTNLVSDTSNVTKVIKNNKSKEASQTKFKLDDAGEIKFDTNNKIKQQSVLLASKVSEFLEDNKLPNIYIEPFIGLSNENITIINAPLSDEDLFIDELLTKITQSPVKISSYDVNRCVVLLTNYSTKCSS